MALIEQLVGWYFVALGLVMAGGSWWIAPWSWRLAEPLIRRIYPPEVVAQHDEKTIHRAFRFGYQAGGLLFIGIGLGTLFW